MSFITKENALCIQTPEIEYTQNGTDLLYRIVKWNQDRDNLKNFNHYTETKMLAEELYESCLYPGDSAKIYGKTFAETHGIDGTLLPINYNKSDLADAYGDLIFVAAGSIAKLGYDPYAVLKKICDHNDAKGSKKDASGKIIKDKDFVNPVHTQE